MHEARLCGVARCGGVLRTCDEPPPPSQASAAPRSYCSGYPRRMSRWWPPPTRSRCLDRIDQCLDRIAVPAAPASARCASAAHLLSQQPSLAQLQRRRMQQGPFQMRGHGAGALLKAAHCPLSYVRAVGWSGAGRALRTWSGSPEPSSDLKARDATPRPGPPLGPPRVHHRPRFPACQACATELRCGAEDRVPGRRAPCPSARRAGLAPRPDLFARLIRLAALRCDPWQWWSDR